MTEEYISVQILLGYNWTIEPWMSQNFEVESDQIKNTTVIIEINLNIQLDYSKLQNYNFIGKKIEIV